MPATRQFALQRCVDTLPLFVHINAHINAHRLPEVLCVHIKRFSSMVSSKGTVSLRKLDGCIPFGLEMDVKPYCTPDGAL